MVLLVSLFNPPGVFSHTFSLIPLCVFKEMHVCCRKFGKQNLEGRMLLLFTVPWCGESPWAPWPVAFQWRVPASSPRQQQGPAVLMRRSRALCVLWVGQRFLCRWGLAWSHRNQGLFPSFRETGYTAHLYKQIFVHRLNFCNSLSRWAYLNLFEKIFLCYSSEKPCKRH